MIGHVIRPKNFFKTIIERKFQGNGENKRPRRNLVQQK